MTETELYKQLVLCMPPQLDAVTVLLQLNEAYLPGAGESVATRAGAILKLVQQQPKGLARLEGALNEVLGRKAASEAIGRRNSGKPSKHATPNLVGASGSNRTTGPPAESPRKLVANELGTAPRTIRIFLASSEELREDRDAFELYFRQRNDQLRKEGLYLEIDRWENFLDAMSETRLQDEYNKAVRACDIFVSMFFTKTGKFTEEEFDTALRQFKKTRRPLIYTFFKNGEIKIGSAQASDLNSLRSFQERLKALGHFYTSYDNIEHLKRQFSDQLDKLRHNTPAHR